jgi:predicted metalloendopeptidase
MMWRVVHGYIGALSDDFKKIISEYKKAKSGTVEEEPQWRQCMSATDRAFGMPLGLLYINEKFGGGSKEKVKYLLYSKTFLQKILRNIIVENITPKTNVL